MNVVPLTEEHSLKGCPVSLAGNKVANGRQMTSVSEEIGAVDIMSVFELFLCLSHSLSG